MKQLHVDLGERSYPIYIGNGLLERIGEFFEQHRISKKSPLMIITDEQVAKHYLQPVSDRLRQSGFEVVTAVVPNGEKSKSLSVMEKLIEDALVAGLDRSSTIVALGGGVIGDLAGYTAASYMRGIRFVQIPTTILAHDSSVGGKVAVNHRLAKNIIGAFHQPTIVLFDTSTLQSLPMREVRAGLAEVIKHGLIWDASFVQWCEENVDRLLQLEHEALQYALYFGCQIKAQVVSEDEREHSLRAILNLGHTIGHALEAVSEYGELLHGEAISIGMVGAAMISERLGNPSLVSRTKQLLEAYGLPTRIPEHYEVKKIMQAIQHDKKFREGKMVFILPTEIGKVTIQHDVPADLVEEVVESLQQGG